MVLQEKQECRSLSVALCVLINLPYPVSNGEGAREKPPGFVLFLGIARLRGNVHKTVEPKYD